MRVPDAAFLEFPRHLTVGARAAERGDTAVVSNGALRGREKGRTHSILIIRCTVYLLNITCNITISLQGPKDNNPVPFVFKDEQHWRRCTSSRILRNGARPLSWGQT